MLRYASVAWPSTATTKVLTNPHNELMIWGYVIEITMYSQAYASAFRFVQHAAQADRSGSGHGVPVGFEPVRRCDAKRT